MFGIAAFLEINPTVFADSFSEYFNFLVIRIENFGIYCPNILILCINNNNIVNVKILISFFISLIWLVIR